VAIAMLASLRTAAVFGIEAQPVHVEVDVSFGLPVFNMVGLPDASVRESRDRVRSAIRNSGFEFPPHRVTVNLAPADVRKAGAAFDLPIALGILAAQGVVERREIPEVVVLGELSLDGTIQAARGVLPIAAAARRLAMSGVLLPRANASEAAIVGGLDLWPVASLGEAVDALNHPVPRRRLVAPAAPLPRVHDGDLADVHGQLLARRALEIASAGGHNLLFVGPPGAGKTLLARRLATILPPLTAEEALEATAVHSVAGLLPAGAGLLVDRPFRAPHHTISHVALVGGGALPRPGEVSLAHHGVLFLDEMLEFQRGVLDVLRQPLEEGHVTIARAARTVRFPARFVLVGATNPCPCGFAGDPNRICRCTPQQVARYRDKLSGPLRDRLDLAVDVPALPPDVLAGGGPGESSAAVRARVIAARARQRDRNARYGVTTNAAISPGALAACCDLETGAVRLLDAAIRQFGLSARGYDRVRKVARTIADLDEAAKVAGIHLAEAMQFRTLLA
jgi:magnesium chelatase family protein